MLFNINSMNEKRRMRYLRRIVVIFVITVLSLGTMTSTAVAAPRFNKSSIRLKKRKKTTLKLKGLTKKQKKRKWKFTSSDKSIVVVKRLSKTTCHIKTKKKKGYAVIRAKQGSLVVYMLVKVGDGGDPTYNDTTKSWAIAGNLSLPGLSAVTSDSSSNSTTTQKENAQQISNDVNKGASQETGKSQKETLSFIPDYMKANVDKAINRILQKTNKSCIVVPIFTDIHAESTDSVRFKTMLSCIRYMSSKLEFAGLFSLGDEIAVELGRRDHRTNAQIASTISQFHSTIIETCKLPFMPLNGNHDGIGADFFNIPLWNSILKQNSFASNVVREGNNAYYYVDYPSLKFRFVCMSIPSSSVVDVEHPYAVWEAGNEQLSWLANKALNTGDGYTVALLVHVPTCYNAGAPSDNYVVSVWDGANVKMADPAQITGRVEDQSSIEGVFSAYHNHTAFSDSNISCDFSKYKNTRVAVELTGHTHVDCVINPGQAGNNGMVNGMPCKVISIASAGYYTGVFPNYSGGITPLRQDGTSSEVLFDVAVFDLADCKINLIRVGAGSDIQEFSF